MRKSLPKLRLENEKLRGGTGRSGGYSRKERRMAKPGGERVHRTSRDWVSNKQKGPSKAQIMGWAEESVPAERSGRLLGGGGFVPAWELEQEFAL